MKDQKIISEKEIEESVNLGEEAIYLQDVANMPEEIMERLTYGNEFIKRTDPRNFMIECEITPTKAGKDGKRYVTGEPKRILTSVFDKQALEILARYLLRGIPVNL